MSNIWRRQKAPGGVFWDGINALIITTASSLPLFLFILIVEERRGAWQST